MKLLFFIITGYINCSEISTSSNTKSGLKRRLDSNSRNIMENSKTLPYKKRKIEIQNDNTKQEEENKEKDNESVSNEKSKESKDENVNLFSQIEELREKVKKLKEESEGIVIENKHLKDKNIALKDKYNDANEIINKQKDIIRCLEGKIPKIQDSGLKEQQKTVISYLPINQEEFRELVTFYTSNNLKNDTESEKFDSFIYKIISLVIEEERINMFKAKKNELENIFYYLRSKIKPKDIPLTIEDITRDNFNYFDYHLIKSVGFLIEDIENNKDSNFDKNFELLNMVIKTSNESILLLNLLIEFKNLIILKDKLSSNNDQEIKSFNDEFVETFQKQLLEPKFSITSKGIKLINDLKTNLDGILDLNDLQKSFNNLLSYYRLIFLDCGTIFLNIPYISITKKEDEEARSFFKSINRSKKKFLKENIYRFFPNNNYFE
ncbi:hypothetical protein A0H76_1658 [Hepatospora eriocheir]|uniref:Uncharacterized protein n=1 Tax=Hepatospora eriocheir TaxID=1081669 RepID=A0A1X0QGQ8_9MICR|nr:hypothetical protein A0H76_1658 [Hepatospora eriocheir]